MTQTVQTATHASDVIIVGAGPAGSYAALNLAKLATSVTVFEEHSQSGFPTHCAGHLSIRSLRNLGLYPLPEGIVENTFSKANFYSPAGTKFSLCLSQPVTASVNRALFDQHLTKQAQEAGARFVFDSYIHSLVKDDGFVKGVNVRQHGEKVEQGLSKVIIDAEGISSRLLKQAGLQGLNREGLLYGVEAEVENVQDVEPDAVEVYFGKAYAPGLYGWLIPRLDGTAKFGLATRSRNPRENLQRLMHRHPVASQQLRASKITKISYHAITLGGPINRSYANGFLAVGDCASQVKPTTGGGVILSLTCAEIAAKTANSAIHQGDVSENALQVYQKRCSDALRFDFNVMLRLRRFLDSLSDERLDEMLRVCSKFGVDKSLRNVDEIDFQGKMLLQAAWKPSMLATMAYFVLLYFSTNA